MKTRRCFLGIFVILALSCVVSAQRVAGVWRLDEVTTTGSGGSTEKMTQPSMYLFTKSHYSIIYVNTDKPRSTDDSRKMTAEQLRDVYVDNFIANAGTYSIKAGKITFRPLVAKSPSYMLPGTGVTDKIKISGNVMTLTVESASDGPVTNPTTFKLTRVE